MNSMTLIKTDFEPRAYQKNIAEIANQKNTLVVLPTGMGKTLISVLVAVKRLEQFPESKILITAPTRPLNAQHKKSFEKFTTIPEEEIVLITGKIQPENRKELYKKARVIVATPQTIKNDLENNRINLEDFSFVTFDECHRAVKDYAYPYIAKKYMLQAKNPLILGLTASPGGKIEKIQEVCNNLFIKAVEIRTEADLDVEKYVKPIEREFIYVDFPEEFKTIKNLLEEILKDDLYWLKEHHFIPTYRPPKSLLINLQNKIISQFSKSRNFSMMWTMVRLAEAIKLEHAIELLETQGISFLYDFLKKIEASKKKTDKRLMKNPKIIEATKLVEELCKKGVAHPKLEKLQNVVKDLVREKPDAKIIVFANYRATVDKIKNLLTENQISSEILIGQAIKNGKGMTQEEQIEILKKFSLGEFQALCASQIGEEGVDYAADIAIFYEPVPSEIRALQRRGRVGRSIAGKVIFLITKDTRDEAYYFAALRKEKRMKGILYDMKEKGVRKPRTLLDWTVN